jgi:hypothetical protein
MIHGSDRSYLRTAIALGLMFLLIIPSSLSLAEKDKDLRKHFGLIFGTAYGPDDRPVYGARIEIHPVGQKHPHWELFSDHHGEFAQRVPPGPADYLITGQAEIAPLQNGVAANKKKQKIKAEKTVHIQAEERQDVGLHLAE